MEADGVKEVGISNLKDAVKSVYKVATDFLLKFVNINFICLLPICDQVEGS